MWTIINLSIAFLCFDKTNKVKFTLSTVCVVIAALTLFTPLSGITSFVVGSMLYSLPAIVAVGTKYNKTSANIAKIGLALSALEILAAVVFILPGYEAIYNSYEPLALTLYVLLTIVVWRNNDLFPTFAVVA